MTEKKTARPSAKGEPAPSTDETVETEEKDEATTATPRSRTALLRSGGAFVLAGLLLVAALVLVVLNPDVDDDTNVAVADSRTNAQVVDAVTTGIEGAFAYDFRDPAASEDAAEGFFTGDAVEDYAQLRETVATLGEEQSLVYETDVTQVGVRNLVGDEAEALVFLDQTSTRGSDGAVQEAPAQLVLELERNDGTWQVSSLTQL